MNLNNIIDLTGRLTRDPVIEETKNSHTPIMKFTLAVNRIKSREGVDKADFINCVLIGEKPVSVAMNHFKKGLKIRVLGSLQIQTYLKDDEKKYWVEVPVYRWQFSEKKKESDNNEI